MGPLLHFQCYAQRIDEQTAVVHIHGELDMYSSPHAKETMSNLMAEGCRYLLVNLQHTEYLDSTGLGLFVGLLKRVREQGGDVRLISPSPRVRRMLEITRLTMAFGIDTNEDEAMAHLPHERALPS